MPADDVLAAGVTMAQDIADALADGRVGGRRNEIYTALGPVDIHRTARIAAVR
jgi:hypothetical protein